MMSFLADARSGLRILFRQDRLRVRRQVTGDDLNLESEKFTNR